MRKIIFEFSETVQDPDDIAITIDATHAEAIFAANHPYRQACNQYAKKDKSVEGKSNRTSSSDGKKVPGERTKRARNRQQTMGDIK